MGTKRNESFINITWLQSTNLLKEDGMKTRIRTRITKYSSTGLLALRDVAETWLVALPAKRSTGRGRFWFFVSFSLAISVSVSDFPVSFDFSVCVLELSLALARRAFLFSLRRRCRKSLPSEVSLSTFTSSPSVLFLILFGVLEKSSCVGPVS